MKRVLISGAFKFPDKDAAAFRVFSIAKLFNDQFMISFAGWEDNYNGNKKYEYNGYSCSSMGDLEYGGGNVFTNTLRSIFRGYRTLVWISKQRKFDIIILYNPPSIFSIVMNIMCLFSQTRLILDSTEWYESEHLPGSIFSFARIENRARMYLAYKLFPNMICISHYLDNYFKKNSIVIPPLFGNSISSPELNPSKSDTITFLYAGQLGKKDKLETFILTLPELSKKYQLKLKLIVLGLNYEQLVNAVDDKMILEKCGAYIECMGRVSKAEVESYYEKIHFVVFFRENKRYALAGFPSKSIEAWQHGKPIITNSIGELKQYLEDGTNSLVIENNIAGVQHVVKRIAQVLENRSYNNLSKNALITFEKNFTTFAFQKKFQLFIDNLK